MARLYRNATRSSVQRAAQSMGSSYAFHLNARADKLEFLITATGVSDTTIWPKLAKLELRFITKGETTTVEMRDSAVGDLVLNRDLWSIVERRAQQVINCVGPLEPRA